MQQAKIYYARPGTKLRISIRNYSFIAIYAAKRYYTRSGTKLRISIRNYVILMPKLCICNLGGWQLCNRMLMNQKCFCLECDDDESMLS